MINLTLPKENKCPSSVYQFEKSISDIGFSYTRYITCWKCQHPLDHGICVNNACAQQGENAAGDDSSTFYIIDVPPEMKRLISGERNMMSGLSIGGLQEMHGHPWEVSLLTEY